MKKLLIISLLAFALCACEAPDNSKTEEKETIILDGNTDEAATEESTGGKDSDEASAEDEKTADEQTAEPTPAPTVITDNTDNDTNEPGPTPTPAVSVLPDGGDIVIDIGTAAAGGNYAKGKELFCAAASEKEGRDIAALYGITFVDFGYGIATFTTGEDPAAVVKRGKDNGWKALDINYISTIK